MLLPDAKSLAANSRFAFSIVQFVSLATFPMRYLILTDIHANLEALDSCLADARSRGYDRTLVLGDVVGYGADPNAVIERIQRLEPHAIVRGNHDKVSCGIEQADHRGRRPGYKPEQHEQQREHETEDEIRRHPGGGNDDVALLVVAVFPRIDRHRLRPPKHHRPPRQQEGDRREGDAHDRVDVRQRIERDPAQHVGRIIALTIGRHRMGVLVRHQGEDQGGKGDDKCRER